MTSRNSFISHSNEELKHNLPQIVLTIFVFIIAFLIFVLNISNAFAELGSQDLPERITQYCQPGINNIIVALMIATGLGVSAFTHLHFRNQADFYHSLPITRGETFLIRCFTSFVIFLLPVTIYSIAKTILLVLVGYGNPVTIGYVWLTYLCMILAFIATWVTVALAMILTGHLFVGILGFGVFACYFPLIIQFLPSSYMSTFYATYTYGEAQIAQFLNFLSPVSISFGMVDSYMNWAPESHLAYFIAAIIWSLVIGLIDYKLYEKRPAEAAGHAMAFEKWNPLLRFILVIPMTLYAGIFLIEIATNRSMLWLYLGLLLGGFIFHGIVECIFQMDIKGIISHKLHLGITLIICFVFSTIFIKDIFHYDEWIPAREDVEKIVLSTDESGDKDMYFYGDPSLTLKPDGLTGENVDLCMNMVQDIIDNQLETMKANKHRWTVDVERVIPITVEYHLKNGTTKTRSYSADPTNLTQYLDPIYATEDYKNDIYRLYTIDRSKIKTITWDNAIDYELLKYDEETMNQFLDIYLEELSQINFTELHSSNPIAELAVTYDANVPSGYSSESYYYIYPSYEKTIAFLKDHGIEKLSPFEEYSITKMDITTNTDGLDVENYQITDKALIEKYRSQLQCGYFYISDYNSDFNLDIEVTIHNNHNEYTIPAFVPPSISDEFLKDASKLN